MTGSFDFSLIEKAMKDLIRQGLANRGATVRAVVSDVSAVCAEGDDRRYPHRSFRDADMPVS
jgi:hypothetical protein